MVFIPPPYLASATRPSYAEAYASILAAHRRSPLTSASSVIVLVAPDVDALCAARMLADIFKQDDVMHRIIPVSGMAALEKTRNDLLAYSELHTLVLLNMGSILELPSPEWFGDFPEKLNVHVIDSNRPQNLSSLFDATPEGKRIVMWEDGGAEELASEREAYNALMMDPDEDSEDDSADESDDEEPDSDDEANSDVDTGDEGSSTKRKRPNDDERKPGKRRKRDDDADRPRRLPRDVRDEYSARIERHYMAGTWYGQSAAGIIYVLATLLERVDNELLWLAILGLTFQYTSSRISREKYEVFHQIYQDEVARLNPISATNASRVLGVQNSLSPDDLSIRTTEELRFMLFRHWTLYDAMYHSSYVAGRLGIWKERGRKKLTGLLAKMGFSIPQTQQQYSHMDMDLKRDLRSKLEAIAPEYGLVELVYPSFMRCYGYRCPPLSSADVVEALSALLDIAGGVRIELEVEGARNGGEWFGGGRIWSNPSRWDDERENIPPGGVVSSNVHKSKRQESQEEVSEKPKLEWWINNFWTAFDALSNVSKTRDALALAMSLHRAIIRRGSSIIDKQDIRTMNRHRVVILTQGPDMALFAHPGVLSRLALWLVEALRDRAPAPVNSRGKKKPLPFVVACLNERTKTYVVVGVTAAALFGDVRKNQFGLTFLDAKERCNARTRHGSFDTSVIEINQEDLNMFLQALCNTPAR